MLSPCPTSIKETCPFSGKWIKQKKLVYDPIKITLNFNFFTLCLGIIIKNKVTSNKNIVWNQFICPKVINPTCLSAIKLVKSAMTLKIGSLILTISGKHQNIKITIKVKGKRIKLKIGTIKKL